MTALQEINRLTFSKLFEPSKEYFIENRKSDKTGIGRVAKSLVDYATGSRVSLLTTRNTIFSKVSQFSVFNAFLLLFSCKNKCGAHMPCK